MEAYLKFEKFVTPVFIQVIFWIGVAGIVLWTIMAIGMASSYGGGGLGGIVALLLMIVLVVFWRVYCEIMLVIFRIHSELQGIRLQGGARP